jgi:hypothetical protein
MPDRLSTAALEELRLRADAFQRHAGERGPLPPSHEQTLHDLQESLEELRVAEEVFQPSDKAE